MVYYTLRPGWFLARRVLRGRDLESSCRRCFCATDSTPNNDNLDRRVSKRRDFLELGGMLDHPISRVKVLGRLIATGRSVKEVWSWLYTRGRSVEEATSNEEVVECIGELLLGFLVDGMNAP
jgi:hypothetical protein